MIRSHELPPVRGCALRGRLAACCVVLAYGCSRNESPPPAESKSTPPAQTAPAAPSPTPAATAASGDAAATKLFKARCVVCHGQSGKGDGPGAAALTVKPRDYTNAEWQKTVTDEEISKIILQGGAAVGKSPNMPANPDLASKPEVLQGLVKVVRSFAQ